MEVKLLDKEDDMFHIVRNKKNEDDLVILENENISELTNDINNAPVFDFENVKFGFDALEDSLDDYDYSTVGEYDEEWTHETKESTTNYIKEIKEVMTDEEIEELCSRFFVIQGRKTSGFNEILSMAKDFSKSVKLAKDKHGSWLNDSDVDDEKKDDVRMLTKTEATHIIDVTLAERLPIYILALENFKRDTTKTISFMVIGSIIISLLCMIGFVVLLPVTAVLGTFAGIGNTLALIRDMKRTRLVIVKEIDRIQKTIASLDKEKDARKIKDLTEVLAVLMRSSGYDEKDPKWKKLRDPEVVKKIMESIQYFGGDLYGIDEININILEAETDESLDDAADETQKELETKNENGDETTDTANNDNDNNDNNDDNENSGEYGGVTADDIDNATENSSTFTDEGGEDEKHIKLNFALNQLDELQMKYTHLYKTLILSDSYSIIVNDEKNPHKNSLELLVVEFKMALQSLNDYIVAGDRSTYSIVALKLSAFKMILSEIDKLILNIIKKDMQEEENKLNK